MEIEIRKARIDDSSAILALIKELAKFEREPDAVIVSQIDIEKHGFGENPLFKCYVAIVDQKIVGIALFYARYSTWKGPTLHLEDLIVTEKMKGNGIGTALYGKFIDYAYSSGVARVEWNVLDWNESAISFYEKSGAKVLSDWRTVQMQREQIRQFLNNSKRL